MREHREVVGGHLVGGVVHKGTDVGFCDGDLQPKAGVTLQIPGHLRSRETELSVQVPLVADAVDGHALVQHLLQPRVYRVALGVRAVLTGDVVVVVEEQGMRVRLARPLESLRDDARTEVGDPEVVRVDTGGVGVKEELVRHVPLPDLAPVAPHFGKDVLLQQSHELGTGDGAVGDSGGEPGGQLVVPQQRVPAHQLPVLRRERNQAVGTRPVELPLGRLDHPPLHLVARGDGGELFGQDGRVGGGVQVERYDGGPDVQADRRGQAPQRAR